MIGPFLVILVIVLAFFHPVWLQGLIPLPADFIVGVYYPWLDYKWLGFESGVPVKNPITTDVVSFIYPMQMLALEQLKNGVVPLWNNLILAGTPLMANFQSAPFSPTNFVYLLPNLVGWSIQVMLQPFLAALFLYLLLRSFHRSKMASITGGIFYAFAGFITIWMQWNGHGLTAAFFPLVMLLVLRWIRQPTVLNGVVISIVLALQVFSGYPQIIIYQFMALGVVVLANIKRALPLIIFFALGFGLAAIQLLPAVQLLSNSQREIEDVINVSAFLPWQYIITLVAPDFFGNHATGNFWGEGDYTLVTGYSGVVVVVLAGIGVQAYFRKKEVLIALGLVALAIIIALPNPITILLKQSGVLGLQAASAHRALFLLNYAVAILAAFGLEALLLNKINFKIWLRSLYTPLTLLVSFSLALVLIYLLSKGQLVQLNNNITVGLRNLVLPTAVLLVCSTLIFLSVRFKKYAKVLTVFIIALAIVELFRFGWKFTPFSPAGFVFPKTPVLEFLQKQPKSFRVFAEDVIPINFLMAYGLETLEGYDAVYPLRSAEYISSLNSGLPDNTPMGRYGSISNPNSRLLDVANVKYVLVLKIDQGNKPDKDGQVPAKFYSQKYKTVFEDRSVAVLENSTALPRSFIVYDWEVFSDGNLTLSKLIEDFPINQKVILEQDPDIQKQGGSVKEAIYRQQFDRKIIEVETDKEGLLFVADAYYPGWKAYVDAVETKLIRANYNFMAVPVKPGKYTVDIRYQPDSFEFGARVSGISFVCILILLGWYYISRKKDAKV